MTVDSPGSASAGTGSPQGVTIGLVTALSTRHLTDLCKYEEPSQQSGCTSAWSTGMPALEAELDLPHFKDVKLGYTVIDGDKALTGITGTGCVLRLYPSCYTNNNPAAILDSGKSFGTLWSQSLTSTRNVYSLSPAIKINGNWYAYTVNSTPVYS